MSDAPNQNAPDSTGSYRRILAATSLLGGATAINMLVGMARAKIVALLLGKSGMGVMGMYLSISGLVTSFASLGLNYSGVRELASARTSGDEALLGRTLHTLWRLTLLLAGIGAFGLAAAALPVSWSSFGNGDHTWNIALLSLTIAANLLINYYVAVVQSTGQVSRVASFNVVSGVASALVSILCFWLWQRDGIVISLVAAAAVQAAMAWWLARAVPMMQSNLNAEFSGEIARRLVRVGGLVIVIGQMASTTVFAVRAILMHTVGEEGAGVFQSAYGLSGMYATYILGAMGTDFLPRLSAVNNDNQEVNRLVNEQTLVALLLGLPGVVGTVVMAPVLIPFFYSRDFSEAIPVLQLMAVGIYGRMLSWPLSFALIAKNEARASLISEFSSHATQLAVLWFCVPIIGTKAAGVAVIAAYLVYTLVIYRQLKRVTGQRWDTKVWHVACIGLATLGAALCATWLLPSPWNLVAGSILLIASGLYSLKQVTSLGGITHSGVVRRIKLWLSPGQSKT